MEDPRVQRLAELVVVHSLDLRAGQVVRIDGSDAGIPLMVALHAAAVRAGAFPYISVELDGTAELLLAEGNDEQLAYVSDIERDEMERADAVASVWAAANTRALTQADPGRHGRHLA